MTFYRNSLDISYHDMTYYDMFIGRDKELRTLQEMYDSDRFEMAVVYGRRRVGKSELIKKFCENKPTIHFAAVENSAAYNLSAFATSIFNAKGNVDLPIPNPEYAHDYVKLLDYLVDISQKQKIILVIDEYPYLAKAEKAFSSILQKYIDNSFSKTNSMLILCGSSMSFMENQVLGYKSPLYGRRTAQFKIEPFDYVEASRFVDNYSQQDKLLTYGIFGGTPYYLAQINNKINLQSNFQKLFFTTGGLLFEEPVNLIKQELREPQVYNSIITAIANGSTRIAEIAGKIQKSTNLVDKYIRKLIALGLVKREKPYGEKLGKRSIYILSENMFKFWFKYVQDNMSMIMKGFENEVAQNVWLDINNYMGRVFEDICTQFLWNNYKTLPIKPREIGRWWGNNPAQRCEEEIDILAIDGDSAIFGECKFRNEKLGSETLENIKRKSDLFKVKTKYYYLFSKSGFTNEVMQIAAIESNIRLLSLNDLI